MEWKGKLISLIEKNCIEICFSWSVSCMLCTQYTQVQSLSRWLSEVIVCILRVIYICFQWEVGAVVLEIFHKLLLAYEVHMEDFVDQTCEVQGEGTMVANKPPGYVLLVYMMSDSNMLKMVTAFSSLTFIIILFVTDYRFCSRCFYILNCFCCCCLLLWLFESRCLLELFFWCTS